MYKIISKCMYRLLGEIDIDLFLDVCRNACMHTYVYYVCDCMLFADGSRSPALWCVFLTLIFGTYF